MSDPDSAEEAGALRTYSSERAKAFIDAVVAIALTLLILPLMESVGEVASREEGAARWLDEHASQLISFVIIAVFWMSHHRLFSVVERVTSGLLWITMAWLLSIVWLPVATAMSGQMSSDDQVVKAVYIGTMIVTSLVSLATRAYLLRHPSLHVGSADMIKRGMSADIAMALLFAVALVTASVWTSLGYWPMLAMLLIAPIQPVIARMLGVGGARRTAHRD